MHWITDKIDVVIARLMIWSLKRCYGADCTVSDLDEFPEEFKSPKDVFHSGRCASCRAKEIVDYLEKHINLMQDI